MKNWHITGFFAILIIILLLASGCTGTGSTGTTPSNGTAGQTVNTQGLTETPTPEVVIHAVTVPTVPASGVYVHINYLGSWNGSYGMPSALMTVTNSGNRYYPVENATGTVQAAFKKRDDSTRETLVVEILKDGNVLTTGNTSAGFGNVTLSVPV